MCLFIQDQLLFVLRKRFRNVHDGAHVTVNIGAFDCSFKTGQCVCLLIDVSQEVF